MKPSAAPWYTIGFTVYGQNLKVCECESLQDAALIAAAPALLGALKNLVSWDTQTHPGEYQLAMKAARTAIAKAEGAQPSPS